MEPQSRTPPKSLIRSHIITIDRPITISDGHGTFSPFVHTYDWIRFSDLSERSSDRGNSNSISRRRRIYLWGHFTVSLPFGQRHPQFQPARQYPETLRGHIVRITRSLWIVYPSGQHEKRVVVTYHNAWYVPYVPRTGTLPPSYHLSWQPTPVLSFLHN